jgi:hypothetical protein
MKTKNFESSFDIFAVYSLTSEEMISVRGGDTGDPGTIVPPPPVKI